MKMVFSKCDFLVVCALVVTLSRLNAADLSEDDHQFLSRYERVRAALAVDKLEDAKKAARELGTEGKGVATSDQLATARTEFAKLSARAVRLAYGQSGYYVVRCPMSHNEWAQPAGAISNPYAGSAMSDCGMIKRVAPTPASASPR